MGSSYQINKEWAKYRYAVKILRVAEPNLVCVASD
jgi:hypothetical protein